MKKTAPLSLGAQEGEKKPPSAGSEEEKQVSHRHETEEMSSISGALVSLEVGASTAARILVDSQATSEECQLDRDGDRYSKTTMGEVTRKDASLYGKPDCPADLPALSFSRRSTAAFTSRGNSCRFLNNGTGGELVGANGTEEAGERALQEVPNHVDKVNEPEMAKGVPAIQQEQPGTDIVVAVGSDRSPEEARDGRWSNDTPSDTARKPEEFFREPERKGCSIAQTSEHGIQISSTAPVTNDSLSEQHTVAAIASDWLHRPTMPRTHHRSSLTDALTTLQEPLFQQENVPPESAALSPGECELSADVEFSVKNSEIRQKTKGGEATVENEAEEKTAFLTDAWQFKRSASDGPSAILGIWRNGGDTRRRGSREAKSESTREDARLNVDLLSKIDHENDWSESSRLRGIGARDGGGKQKWDLTHSRAQHAATCWNSPLQQPSKAYERLERGELNIIRSLSSSSQGNSVARGRGGMLGGGVDGAKRAYAGNCVDHASALHSESPAQGKRPGSTHAMYPLPPAGHDRDSRRASSTGNEESQNVLTPDKPGKKGMCTTSRWSQRISERGDRGIEGALRISDGTPRGQTHRDPDHTLRLPRPDRGSVLPLSIPLYQQHFRKVAHEKLASSRECHGRFGETVEKLHENVSWKNIERATAISKGNDDEELWDAIEISSPLFSARSPGTDAEAINTVVPCVGAADSIRRRTQTNTQAEGGIYMDREEAFHRRKSCVAVEETDGERLVRELVEEFDKRRTNFSILVPKVLELVGVLMGQPAGTQLPCVVPKNFSPAASLLRPAPLPICATFSEVGQTSTIENLERCFPSFNLEGGLLLCTQGRRLESGGGGKYYFQDSRGHVVGCHKKHLARYDAQGKVASPVLLKTLLFCLVLRQVSRAKRAHAQHVEQEVLRLPAPAVYQHAASCPSFSLPPLRKSFSSCDSSRNRLPEDQDAGAGKKTATKAPEGTVGIPPSKPSRVLRSLFDPLPPADALLAEVQSSARKKTPVSTSSCSETEERQNDTGSTSTGTCSSSSLTTLLEELETSTMRRKTAGGEEDKEVENGGLSLQGSKLLQRSESCIGIPQETARNDEGHAGVRISGKLRRAVSSSPSGLANKQPSEEQKSPQLGSSPASKREAELWGCVSEELRTACWENKPFLKESNKNAEVEQPPDSTLHCTKEQIKRPLLRESGDEEADVHNYDEIPLCQDEEGDESKPDKTESPSLSSAASSGCLTSCVMYPSPLWDEGEKSSTRPAKYGMLSVVRSSNPQRLVRVYRSLVLEDKTHVVERLLRVWSMTLHVRISQSPHPENGVSRTPPSSSHRDKATAKTLFMRKDAEAGVGTRRQKDLNDETYERRLSVSRGKTGEQQEEGGSMQKHHLTGLASDETHNTCSTPRRQGAQERGLEIRHGTPMTHARWRDGDRRTGIQAAETFPLRKANTTECGRILRSSRAAEKSIEALVKERGGGRGTQNPYEDLQDDTECRRRIPGLRRASTSARGDLSLERRLSRYKAGSEAGQEEFSGTNYVRSPSPVKPQQLMSYRKKNDWGQKAGCCSHLTPTAEMVGQNEVFLWRPCMSILWVKPLTVEQTMLKWSKSTPLYEPIEELEEEGRDSSLHAVAMEYRDSSPRESPLLSAVLRSTQSNEELCLKPTSTPKASYIDKLEGKRIGLLSPCSPDSVRSELSTTADCASSLPPSPLFARASALVGLSQMDQQTQALQQVVMLPRLQSTSLPPSEQSPTSLELLQAIQKHLLQLIQRGEAEKATPGGAVLPSLPPKPPKENSSSTTGSDDNTKSQSTEIAPAQAEKTLDAQARRCNTWTAPGFRGSPKRIGDDAAILPMPDKLIPPKNSIVRPPLQGYEAEAEVSDHTRAKLNQSSIDSAEVSVVPHRLGRERENSLPSMLPAISGPGLCPFAGLDLADQSPRSPRILRDLSAKRGSQSLGSYNAASDDENPREASAHFEEPIAASLGLRPSGGSLDQAHGSSTGERLRAGVLAEGEKAHEGFLRGKVRLAETELSRNAAHPRGGTRATTLHRSSSSHQRRSSPSLLDRIPPLETARTEPNFVLPSGARVGLSFQTSGAPEADLDSLSLISRLLGLTVGDHIDEGLPPQEDQTVPTDNGTDHARRSGQSSRKRGLNIEETHKQEEEGGSEGRKKIAVISVSSSAVASAAEKSCDGAAELVHPDGHDKTAFAPTHHHKKTKWTGLFSNEEPREENAISEEVADKEKATETPRYAGGRFMPERDNNDSANTRVRRLTWNPAQEQSIVHQELVDLFTQMLQHSASATDGTPRGRNA